MVAVIVIAVLFVNSLAAQVESKSASTPSDAELTTAGEEPRQIDVEPIAEDKDIAARLLRILNATEWFGDATVRVEEGVVFLSGRAEQIEYKEWATRLAQNTQDVVAVVNRMELQKRPVWDLTPAMRELRTMGDQTVQSSPLLLSGLLLLILSWIAATTIGRFARRIFQKRLQNELLRGVGAKVIALLVFLLGLYLALRVSGLTNLAMTVVGGTGLLGLAVGIAFRDIAENFLASLLISVQRPFRSGDLIQVAGYKGYVQGVTTRGTLLMTLDGNHVQIPNATIYKDTIVNFTSNPNLRLDFSVGIGFDSSIPQAQTIARNVLEEHPAVLSDPEPVVLVEELGAATVKLRIYAWVNGQNYSPIKVRSLLIRQTKQAFEGAGISMPDEAREIVFSNALDVRKLSSDQLESPQQSRQRDAQLRPTRRAPALVAEGDLANEAAEIERQAKNSRPPDDGPNLLKAKLDDQADAAASDSRLAASHNGGKTTTNEAEDR